MSEKLLDKCPVCVEKNLRNTTVVLPEGTLLECPQCGQHISQCTKHWYHESMMEFEDPQGTWPAEYARKRSAVVYRRRLKQIQKYLGKAPQQIRLLDVGASSGAFLLSAKQLGFQAEGVEPAKAAAETACSLGLNVHFGTLDSLSLPSSHFDAITLFEVIEHLSQPYDLLQKANTLLKPGGIMMIGTGNAKSWTATFMKERWEYYHMKKHGGHISFFNTGSIALLAERANFKVLSIKTRCVRFFEKEDVPKWLYRTFKLLSESLNMPSQWFQKGHDMLVILGKL